MSLQTLSTVANVIGVIAVLQLGPDLIERMVIRAKDVRSMSADKEKLATRLSYFRDVASALQERIASNEPSTTAYGSLVSRFPLDAFKKELDRIDARLHPDNTFWTIDVVKQFLWTYSKRQLENDMREIEHFREAAILALDSDQRHVNLAFQKNAWGLTLKSHLQDSDHNLSKLSTTLAALQETAESMQDELSVMVPTVLTMSKGLPTLISDVLFDKLPRAAQALYDDASSISRRGACTAKTREAVLAGLELWASDNTTERIYWLNGMAGTGKTTIAYSLCDVLNNTDSIMASFFCSRSVEECTKVELIIPTIAYEFARRSAAFRAILRTVLENEPNVGSRVLSRQFQNLLVTPSGSTLPDKPCIAIIDALDECANQKAVQELLSILFRCSKDLPIKFLITSRPEQVFRGKFNVLQPETYAKCILHDIEKSLVDADITLYITEQLLDMVDGRSDFETLPGDWPPNDDVDKLVRLADRLFIVAATTCHFISGKGNIRRRLADMTAPKAHHSTEKTSTIDALYADILKRSYDGLMTEEKYHVEIVISAVIAVRDPLTTTGLGMLLDLSKSDVKTALSHLHSLIHVHSGGDSRVSPFHASFPDFMMDHTRSQDLFQDSTQCHHMLASRCLKILNLLAKNICGLPGHPPNADIDPKLVAEYIPEHVSYACIHWISHLTVTRKDDWCDGEYVCQLLEQFFLCHVLPWFEHLSLLGRLRVAVDSLHKLEIWTMHAFPRLSGTVLDARRFIMENFEVISQFSMETYRSALVWLPTDSHIRKRYNSSRLQMPKVLSGLRKSWGTCEQVITYPDKINSVAFSPDGTRIASGASDGSVQVWQTASGEEEIILRGQQRSVACVMFSPDGSRILSVSEMHEVQIWQIASGLEELVFQLDSDSAWSVAFSPDGTRIVSVSSDAKVRIWQIASGEEQMRIEGQSVIMRCVAFSPDGTHIVSGSDKGTVRVWKSTSGKEEMKVEGHPDWVLCVAFSPDGTRIASGSRDNTVRIWKIATGEEEMTLEGHSSWVRCVAFSPDGAQIVSGSDDCTGRIWQTASGEEELRLQGHSRSLVGVAFSPDGTRIVSTSGDCTVRIWQNVKGEEDIEEIRHAGRVELVAFSPDGTRIVTASGDSTLRIWQTVSGEVELVLEGHSSDVRCAVWSPDGARIASGSSDRTLRIWKTANGEEELSIEGHSGNVRCAAFSPDCSRIVSASDDHTVRVWQVASGEEKMRVEGFEDWVQCVAFSPDATLIVAGSAEGLLRICRAASGEEVKWYGHSDRIGCVAFSPDGTRMVSGSAETTRIWRTANGELDTELEGVQYHRVLTIASSLGGARIATTLEDTILGSDATAGISCAQDEFDSPDRTQNWFDDHGYVNYYHSRSKDWIMSEGDERKCFMPGLYRDFESFDSRGSSVCLGYPSGRLVIIHF